MENNNHPEGNGNNNKIPKNQIFNVISHHGILAYLFLVQIF